MTTPGPGWHADPEGNNQLRYWDGQQWTSATQPTPQPTPPSTPPEPVDPEKLVTDRKRALIGVGIVAVLIAGYFGINNLSSTKDDAEIAAAETTTPKTETSLPDNAIDQAGVACMAALEPKVDSTAPAIRNHSTTSVGDTFVTVGQVSKYVGGENPYNYQFECTTRFDGKFTAEVTQFTELARTEILTQSVTPAAPTSTMLPVAAQTSKPLPSTCTVPAQSVIDQIDASFIEADQHLEDVFMVYGLKDVAYIGANIMNSAGTRLSSADVWAQSDGMLFSLSGDARRRTALPDGRRLLDISAGDKYGQAVSDCIMISVINRNVTGGN